jgi:hypothetical protein
MVLKTIPLCVQIQAECGTKKISQSLCSKIRKEHFPDYQVKRRADGFARCGRCDNLTKHGSASFKHMTMLLETHLRKQEYTRAYYYLSRARSIHRPMQVLCIMHDKMDHSKTASPCFALKTKSVDAYLKLPISVTRMIAHGHGDKKYAHYALDLYPADSNCTIGSIARLLRDLERPPKYSNPESFLQALGRQTCMLQFYGDVKIVSTVFLQSIQSRSSLFLCLPYCMCN